MTEEVEEHQPPLTICHISYTRGELEGKPCIVVYNSATDKTDVIAFKSKNYDKALMAITLLEVCATPVPKSALNAKTAIAMPKKPRLILPGSDASN